MTRPLNVEEITGERKPVGYPEWTERERALLEAWDDGNAPVGDDDAFKLRVLGACRGVDALPLHALEAEDQATRSRMVADADAEHQCAERESAERNAAVREIAELHEGYLHAVALRLSGNREIAKDLVQDTLARALVHFDRFKPGTKPRAWLTTILTHLYLDHVKHEKVATRAVHELATQDAIERDLDRGFLSIPHETLWGAVEALDAELRPVVELRYRQQWSYREIASELGLPVGTVGTRLMRAYDRLWQSLRLRAA